MGYGLIQLVAYGEQDKYLTGNPQITFFKVVFRRHTNFSMESIEQIWNGNELNTNLCSEIMKDGDLIYNMYLNQHLCVYYSSDNLNEIKNKDMSDLIFNPSHLIIEDIEIEIGGQLIDKQSGKWMEVYSQLTELNSSSMSANIGYGTKFQNMAKAGGVFVNLVKNESFYKGKKAYKIEFNSKVPLRFWFCKTPGASLPIISLYYHEITINLKINKCILDWKKKK